MASEAQTAPNGDGDLIDLRSLGLIARRRLRVFAVVAGIIFVLGLVVTMALPATYSGTSTVLIDRRITSVTDVASVLSGLPADSASVDTEVQVLSSPALMKQVVEKLRLDRNPEFNGALEPPSLIDQVTGFFRNLFPKSPPAGPNRSLQDRVALKALNNLSVQRKGLTYIITISFSSRDPRTAAAVANALAETYLQDQIDQKRVAASTAQSYLGSRLSGLRGDVIRNESAADDLRARNGLPQNNVGATFDETATLDLNRQAIELRSQVAQKRAQLAAARAARANPATLPSVIESQTVRELKAQRANAVATATDVANRYGPLHPETQKARAQLAEIDAEIAAEMGRIVSSLSNEVDAAEGQLGVVEGALAAQRGQTVANARASVAVDQYERQATASRDLYADFLKRTKETAESGDLAKPDAAIVALSTVPGAPSAPNRTLFALLAFVLAIGCGVFAVILAEILDVKISSGGDVERHLGLPRIASVPGIGRADAGNLPLLAARKPLSSFAEAFRAIGSHIAGTSASPAGGAKVVMIASALPHEGKTVVASALALSLARAGKRVLLVEADLRRPHVAEAIGVARPKIGLGEAVAQQGRGDTGIIRAPELKLDLLLVGSDTQQIEMFRGDSFARYLEWIRADYDHIVIDTAPVLAIADARDIAQVADTVLFVTRWRRTSRYAAAAAVAALRQAGAPLEGVVLNGVNLKTQSLYARDDSLAFYGAYRAYYAE